MIKYIIIDDEPIAHRIIEGYADNLVQLQKMGNCYDAFEAIQMLGKETVDLLFLDINMPKLSGFELLSTLTIPPKVIVTSAYKEHALTGFEFDVCDYLLKPFSLERFVKAVNKVEKLLLKDTPASIGSGSVDKQIFVKGDKKHHQISFDDILLIEAYGNYCKIHLSENVIITLQKISEFEKKLPGNFLRVHKSFVVPREKIKLIEGNRIHIEDHKIPIGQTYRNVIKQLYS